MAAPALGQGGGGEHDGAGAGAGAALTPGALRRLAPLGGGGDPPQRATPGALGRENVARLGVAVLGGLSMESRSESAARPKFLPTSRSPSGGNGGMKPCGAGGSGVSVTLRCSSMRPPGATHGGRFLLAFSAAFCPSVSRPGSLGRGAEPCPPAGPAEESPGRSGIARHTGRRLLNPPGRVRRQRLRQRGDLGLDPPALRVLEPPRERGAWASASTSAWRSPRAGRARRAIGGHDGRCARLSHAPLGRASRRATVRASTSG